MPVLDFLFNGSPPPQATSYSSTAANLPDWFSAYAQGMLAKTSAVAGEPFQAFTGPRVAGLSTDQNSAFGQIRATQGTAQPALAQGQALTNTAAGTSSVAAAQPYLMNANQTFTGGNVANYMNPYMTNVTDRIAELGNRNLMEKVLPGVQDQFIAAGQAGSDRSADFTGRAIRDTAGEIAGAQAGALSQGYNMAGQMFQSDIANQGRLAQLTGQLTSDTAGRELAAGKQLGDMGALGQQVNLRDAAALEAIGATRQAQEQRNLDTAYGAFVEERDYPRRNIELLNTALRGVNAPQSTTTTSTGPVQSMGSSPLAQLAGAGLSAAALGQIFNRPSAARGGHVRRLARGGPVRPVRRAQPVGALSYGARYGR